jgi:hypothetical protein
MGAARLARSTDELKLMHIDPVHCIGNFVDIQISISRGEPSIAFLEQSIRFLRASAKEYPQGVGLLIVISADAPPPSEAAREHIKKGLIQLSGVLRGAARVIEGQGFPSAAKRSALALLDLILRMPYPTKIFGSSSDAAVWLVQSLGPAPHRRYGPTQIVNAVEELRKLHGAQMPRPAARV